MFGCGLVCLEEQIFGASTPARYADCDLNENIWHELGVPMKGAEAKNQPGVNGWNKYPLEYCGHH